MINILIADDHALVRNGLKKIITSESDLTVSFEAKNGEEVLQILSSNTVDLVVLDLNMPGRSGLDILADIKRLYPKLPVLILSINPEDQFARRCLRAGASGYMNKDIEPEDFIGAIRKIAQGYKYFSPAFMETLLQEMDSTQVSGKKELHELLSDREFEVFRMMAARKRNQEIADALSISAKTVSSYRARILEKLNVPDNEGIVNYAINNNLI